MILISDDGCNLLGFKGNMNRIRGYKCTNDMGKNALAKTINDIPILSHNFFFVCLQVIQTHAQGGVQKLSGWKFGIFNSPSLQSRLS